MLLNIHYTFHLIAEYYSVTFVYPNLITCPIVKYLRFVPRNFSNKHCSCNHQSTPCFYESGSLRFHVQVRSYHICLSLTYFTQHKPSRYICTLSQMTEFPSFIGWIIFLCVCVYTSHHILFIHSSADTLFPCLGYDGYPTMNMEVQISLWGTDFISSRYTLRGDIVVLYGSSIFNFFEDPP